jgi:DNA-binding transcriptional ArsR family regulator
MNLQELYARLAAGQITDEEAERLDHRHREPKPRRAVGSRPRKPEHVERRRTWAARGKLPPAVAARFTLGEQAVLAVVAWVVQREGDCRKSHAELADMAGVSVSTVRNALREARGQRLIVSEERRQGRWFSLPNIMRIIDREWLAWLRVGPAINFGKALDTSKKERGFREGSGGANRWPPAAGGASECA